MELSDTYKGSFCEEETKEPSSLLSSSYNISQPAKIRMNVRDNELRIDLSDTDTKFLHSIHLLQIFTGDINKEDCELFVAYQINDCFASDKEIKTLFTKDFLPQLSEILVSKGFSRFATENILPMEWALQQTGRARYEAKEIIQEIRNATIDNTDIHYY